MKTITTGKKIFYLASPYSHAEESVMIERFQAAEEAAVKLLKLGIYVFAPIPYNHPWKKYGLPPEFTFWEEFDKTYIDKLDGVIVLTIPGWDASRGVKAEVEYAESKGMPVYFISPEDIKSGTVLNQVKN